MFMITIENLLCSVHEYFDYKMISMKDFPLDFEKVRSTHIYCGFFAQMCRPAKSHDFAVSLMIFDTFSRSHDKGPKSPDFCRKMPVRSGSSKITQ